MNKRNIIISAVAVLIIVILGVSLLGILLPYQNAESTMPENSALYLRQQEDGKLALSWSKAPKADYYRLEIASGSDGEVLFSDTVTDHKNYLLPDLPTDAELIFRINSVVEYERFWISRSRTGSVALEAAVNLNMPRVADLKCTADPGTKSLDISFEVTPGDYCVAYLADENNNLTELQLLDASQWTLHFGEKGLLPIPEYGQQVRLVFKAFRETPGIRIEGAVSTELPVEREDLLGRDLNVVFTDLGNNRFSLRWDETKGDYYEIQQCNSDGSFTVIRQIGRSAERYFESASLEKFKEFTFRVVAVGDDTMAGSFYAAESEYIPFQTRESSIYATVWPLIDLQAYSDVKHTKVTATAKAGTALCVVEERNGMFGVRIQDSICYIDSDYCMINLPDYMGDLCSYQITNSTDSKYLIHEFEIPKVTAVVTPGYQSVKQSDGSYLVPLLYPTAKKLIPAAKEAIAAGYRLKIYDSFRPQAATRDIFQKTSAILDDEIPALTHTGVSVAMLDLPEVNDDEVLTYRQVMTNGTYGMNDFLAQGTSRHNYGVALDLTLEDLYSGEEIPMQTDIHDLSWYSVTGRNNANARLLATFMKGAGFGTLSTEWWHFQDNENYKKLSLSPLRNGISAQGWICDSIGWRYRDSLGTFCRMETVTVDGIKYTFGYEGYLLDLENGIG